MSDLEEQLRKLVRKAKVNIEQSVSMLRRMTLDYPEKKEDILDYAQRIKQVLSENAKPFLLDSDFCIDKGSEVEQIIKDYLKYDDPDKDDDK